VIVGSLFVVSHEAQYVPEDEPSDISDIPQIREPVELARFFHQMEQLGLFDTDELDDLSEEYNIEDLKEQAEEMAELVDDFNELFIKRGWIMHEFMNIEVVRKAVEKAKDGSMEEAEKELASYYNPEEIETLLQTHVSHIENFRPRMELAEKALEDYREERYHACVPVVLALLDGLGTQAYIDAYGEPRSPSSKEANLEAWNSIAGHSKGLSQLQDIFLKGRKQTRTEDIGIPYRNGIMHGMDLGYDNELVAAKVWGILFAVAEWAKKAEEGELKKPADESKPSLREALQKWEEVQQDKNDIREWEPREVIVGEDIPRNGELNDYSENSPERKLVKFLLKWQENNYGHMAEIIDNRGGEPEEPGLIREQYRNLELRDFSLVEVDDNAISCTDIKVKLRLERFDSMEEITRKVRLIKVGEDGKPSGNEEGHWRLTTHHKFLAPED
jgi:hypothetical protein